MPLIRFYFINIFYGYKSNSFVFVLAGGGAVEAELIGKQNQEKSITRQ